MFEAVNEEAVRRLFLQVRFERRRSQVDVARRAGCSVSLVSALEAGGWYPRRRRGFETLRRLVEVGLETPAGEFERRIGG